MYSRLIYIYSLFKCINTFAATVQFSIRIKLMASMMCSRGWLYRYSATISITVIKWPKKLASTSTFLFFIRCSCSRSFHSFFQRFIAYGWLTHSSLILFHVQQKKDSTPPVCVSIQIHSKTKLFGIFCFCPFVYFGVNSIEYFQFKVHLMYVCMLANKNEQCIGVCACNIF